MERHGLGWESSVARGKRGRTFLHTRPGGGKEKREGDRGAFLTRSNGQKPKENWLRLKPDLRNAKDANPIQGQARSDRFRRKRVWDLRQREESPPTGPKKDRKGKKKKLRGLDGGVQATILVQPFRSTGQDMGPDDWIIGGVDRKGTGKEKKGKS